MWKLQTSRLIDVALRDYTIPRINYMEMLGTGLSQSAAPRDIELGRQTNAVKAKLRRAPVVLVGAFPPPLHGMAAVNAAVREALQRAGIEPWTINLAAQISTARWFFAFGACPECCAVS